MKVPFVSEIIERVAPRIGAKVLLEPEYGFVGQLIFKNGKKAFFRDRNFNINSLGSVEIARDKAYSNFFLKEFEYSVPDGQTFFNDKLNENLKIKRDIDEGYSYAKSLGFPVIVKPNSLSQGTFVMKVHNKREYYRLSRQICKKTSVFIVQKFYEGKDYRIVVLDDEIISAYQRVPLSVIGNGRSTIRDLLQQKQDSFIKDGRDTVIDFEDFRIKLKLKRQKLDFDSIPNKGKVIYLLDNANLSTGGDAIDVTTEIHTDFHELAVRITADMGLRLCGVDIITSDITRPLGEYIVIEINGSPGLDNYASIGASQAEIVDELYLKVLQALEGGK